MPGVREPWQKVVIICTGCNFTFFVVFKVSLWNVGSAADIACHLSSLGGGREFSSILAHSFPLLPFLSFPFEKNHLWGAVPMHTPQTVTGKGGKHVFLASLQLDWLHIIVIWIPVLCFLHFHLSFYFRRNKYPLHREERVGVILLLLRWIIGFSDQSLAGFYGGTHVLYGIYATGWTRGNPWIAQQLN